MHHIITKHLPLPLGHLGFLKPSPPLSAGTLGTTSRTPVIKLLKFKTLMLKFAHDIST